MIPTRMHRTDVLIALFDQLPFFARYSLHFETKSFDKQAVPRVHEDLSLGHPHDDEDAVAKELGVDAAFIRTQCEWFDMEEPPPPSLRTADVLRSVLPPKSILSFEAFAAIGDQRVTDQLFWYLQLPLLDRAQQRARIGAQLAGAFGAKDFVWWAHQQGGAWVLDR